MTADITVSVYVVIGGDNAHITIATEDFSGLVDDEIARLASIAVARAKRAIR